jgi:MOSC domain-containing protein YiiM
MHVEAINIGPSEALEPVGSVTAVAGKGLVGDRHFADNPAPGNALTLIEAEVLADVGLTGAQSRRQVVVRGVRLNDLIGKRFRVGDVECLGVEICEPCLHLQRMTRPGIIKDLIHRGGLNADILSGGTISVGDPVSARVGLKLPRILVRAPSRTIWGKSVNSLAVRLARSARPARSPRSARSARSPRSLLSHRLFARRHTQ